MLEMCWRKRKTGWARQTLKKLNRLAYLFYSTTAVVTGTQLLKEQVNSTARGVRGLDSARGKKQVWRPHVRTWVPSEADVQLKKVLVELLGLFGAPRSLSVPGELRPPCHPSLRLSAPRAMFLWLIAAVVEANRPIIRVGFAFWLER